MKRTLLTLFSLPSEIEVDTAPLKAALVDRVNNKITQRELLIVCLEWTYFHALTDLRPEPMPRKDIAISKVEAMTKAESKELGEEYLNKVNELKRIYYGRVSNMVQQNKANVFWLKRMLGYFLWAGKLDKATKIREELKIHAPASM